MALSGLEHRFCSSVRSWRAIASFSTFTVDLSRCTVKHLGPRRLLWQMTRQHRIHLTAYPVMHGIESSFCTKSRSLKQQWSWNSLALDCVNQAKSGRTWVMYTRREVHSAPKYFQLNSSDSKDNRFEKVSEHLYSVAMTPIILTVVSTSPRKTS